MIIMLPVITDTISDKVLCQLAKQYGSHVELVRFILIGKVIFMWWLLIPSY